MVIYASIGKRRNPPTEPNTRFLAVHCALRREHKAASVRLQKRAAEVGCAKMQ